MSGAHLLLTSERIAVRAYYPSDLQELQEQGEKISATKNDDDFDGLSAFFSSFQLTLVFFILPSSMNDTNMTNLITEQLVDFNSYFHRAQRLSIQHQEEAEGNAMMSNAKEGASVRKSCIMISPDTPSAIENLILVADSLLSQRKASKNILLRRLEQKFFLPSSPSRNNDTSSDTVDPTAVASLVEEGLRKMAQTFDLPMGEVDILKSELGDLKTIATADDSLLGTIPIDNLTRKILHDFFGSTEANVGKISQQIWTSGPDFALEPNSSPKIHGMRNLSDVAAQLFPNSNSSRRQNVQVESFGVSPNGFSNRQPSPARSQGTHSKLHEQPHMEPIMVDESWSEPIDVGMTYNSSFDAGDDGFVDDDNTHLGIQGSPFFPSSEENNRPNNMAKRRSPFMETDGNASQFSSMSRFAAPTLAERYENDSNATRVSRAYPGTSRSYPQNSQYFQQGFHQYQSEQPKLANDYPPSRFPNLHSNRQVPTSRHRNSNHQLPPRYQQPRYFER